MRYVLDVPRSDHLLLEAVAEQENMTPRALLVWLIQKELLARAKQAGVPVAAHSEMAATP